MRWLSSVDVLLVLFVVSDTVLEEFSGLLGWLLWLKSFFSLLLLGHFLVNFIVNFGFNHFHLVTKTFKILNYVPDLHAVISFNIHLILFYNFMMLSLLWHTFGSANIKIILNSILRIEAMIVEQHGISKWRMFCFFVGWFGSARQSTSRSGVNFNFCWGLLFPCRVNRDAFLFLESTFFNDCWWDTKLLLTYLRLLLKFGCYCWSKLNEVDSLFPHLLLNCIVRGVGHLHHRPHFWFRRFMAVRDFIFKNFLQFNFRLGFGSRLSFIKYLDGVDNWIKNQINKITYLRKERMIWLHLAQSIDLMSLAIAKLCALLWCTSLL